MQRLNGQMTLSRSDDDETELSFLLFESFSWSSDVFIVLSLKLAKVSEITRGLFQFSGATDAQGRWRVSTFRLCMCFKSFSGEGPSYWLSLGLRCPLTPTEALCRHPTSRFWFY